MRESSRSLTVAMVLLMIGAATVIGASEPTPTPDPTPAPAGDRSLSDVAGEIKLDKEAAGGEKGIVINNDNLSELAGKGLVTEVTKKGGSTNGNRPLANAQGAGQELPGEAPAYAESMEKKQYWQAIYSQQLELIKDIQKQIDLLDQEIPGLWRDFYSWDDPAYRDGVIKPKLDDALANRQKLEVDRQKAEAKLDKIKSDARRDGSQPGWFRGFEAPPTPRPTEGVMPP